MKIGLRSYLNIKSEFVKNALTLAVGTSIAQAIPAFFYPVLGRIFTPEEFGIMATIMSITAIIAVLAVGRYEGSILIADTKKDAANIIAFILILSFTILSATLAVLLLFSNFIAETFDTPLIKNWLFICPISAFLSIIYVCYNEWCVKNKYFVNLSWNKIINSSSATSGKLLFGFYKISSNGLIIGDILGKAATALTCILRALKKDKDSFYNISLSRMKELALRYIEFPKFSLPGALLNTIGGQLPVILIGIFFNSVEVGLFAMTMSVLSVPSSVISAAIRDTFRQRANEDFKNTGQCRGIFVKTLRMLTIASVLGLVCLIFLMPSIFSFVLGEQWRISGEYSQIMIPALALSFISNSLSGVLVITEKMKTGFLYQIYYLFITFTSLTLGFILFSDIKLTLLSYSIGIGSAYLLELFLNYKYSLPLNESCSKR